MNIVKRELRANVKSLIIWSVIVILFVTVGFSKFSAYEGNPELLAILDSVPPAMMEAFNFSAFNLTTISGFFGVMFTYFALILSISAAMWGTDVITKEERDKTVEFALTLPVTRGKLIASKTAATALNCAVLLGVTWAVVLINSTVYQTNNEFFEFLSLSMVSLFIMQLIFMAIGIFLASTLKQYKRASSVAVAILLGTYFISILSGLNESLSFLKYFTPFQYFNPADLLRNARIDVLYVGLSAVIIAASLVGAYYAYTKRDLYI
jgi:ABC-2 type transport system permease protein